jgi:nitrogen fixation protein FixH
MLTDSQPRARWNPWPASIIAFFAVALAGCGIFIAFCHRHPADLIAADYYEQEMQYQRQLDRLHNTQARASTASVTYEPATRQIAVALPADQANTGATGTIQLYRPSSLNLDRQLELAPGPTGLQTIDATGLLPGLWRVRVSWTVNHQDYFMDRRVVIGSKSS